jgi:hypothetical protein
VEKDRNLWKVSWMYETRLGKRTNKESDGKVTYFRDTIQKGI